MATTSTVTSTGNDTISQALTKRSSNLDKDTFLQLLVTQFKHQDPLNPMEDKEFVAQLSQFTSLEQLMNLNKTVEGMGSTINQQQFMGATSFIGKDVRATGDTISKAGDSMSTLYFSFDTAIKGGYINVFDASNNIIRTETISARQPGSYTYKWDGKDYQGNTKPDGVYKIAIAGEDFDGKAVLMSTEVNGRVTGVANEDGTQYLTLADGRVVKFVNVKQVVEPKAVTSNSGSGSNTGTNTNTNTGT